MLLLILFWLSAGSAVAQPPQRVISLAPHITEMIFALGEGDRLVGRTSYCLYPPAALDVPVIGAYLNPDYEKIVALQPDVVLIFPNAEMASRLSQLGIATQEVHNETVSEMLRSLRQLGELFQKEARAAERVRGIRDTLDSIQQQAGEWQNRSALVLIGREKGSLRALYAAGKNTYLSELLVLCNISNAFADLSMRYFEVSKEDLVLRNPDIIIEFRYSETDTLDVPSLKKDWQALDVLDAVKNDNIFIFTKREYLIPGPRVAQTATDLFNALQADKHD